MFKGLKKLLMIQEEESGQVAYFLFFFLLVSAGMAVGRSTADAMFFKRFGIEYLPVMYIIQSFTLATVSTLYAAFADRVPAESFFKALFGVLILLVGASWLIIANTASSLIYPFYYLVYEVASELLLVHAALYVYQNMNTLQAKRLTPLFYAGAQIGTIIGGVMIALLAPLIGTQNLVLIWCLLLGIGIASLVLRHRRYGTSAHYRAPRKARHPLNASLREVRQGVRFTYRSDLLRAASFAMFFMVIAFYVLCYSVNRVYTQTFETEAALTSFFGALTAVTSGIALLLQLFVTNRIIQHFGVRKINLLFPVTTIGSLFGLVASFTLPAALLGSINKDALMPALRNPVRTMFFNVLPDYIQGRARAMSIAIVMPLALFFCGSLLWLMLKVESTRFFLIPGVMAAGCYFYFNRQMNRAYVATLLGTLKERLFLPEERQYSELQGSSEDVLKEIARGVNHSDGEVAIAFARALIDAFPEQAPKIILQRTRQADYATADRLLGMLGQLDMHGYTPELLTLAEQGDNHLRATVLKVMVEQGNETWLAVAAKHLGSSNPRLRAVAVCAALRMPHRQDVLHAWLELLAMDQATGIAALELIPDLERVDDCDQARLIPAYRELITRLLVDQPDAIRIRVFQHLPGWQHDIDPALRNALLSDLTSGDPGLRAAAAGCLHLLITTEKDSLALQVLGDAHPSVRHSALQALQRRLPDLQKTALRWLRGNQGNPRAQQTLIEHLQQQSMPTAVYGEIASRKADEAGRLQDALAGVEQSIAQAGEASALALLRLTLQERRDQAIQLALLALAPLHEPGIIGIIRAGFSSGDIRHAANAIEALGNLDNRYVADRLHDILQVSIGMQHREKTAFMSSNLEQILAWCMEQPDDWLQEAARHALAAETARA